MVNYIIIIKNDDKKISITFVALLFATISFGQVKSIDERIGEAMNGSNWAELRSLYMSDGKNLQTPFLKPLSKFFISQFYNEPDSAIKYGKEILEKYQDELNSSVPSIMYFMAEDYATLGHYDKASALLQRVIGAGTLVHSFGSMNLSVCHEAHIYI